MSVQSPETLTSWPANHSSVCSSTHTHRLTATNFISTWDLALYLPSRRREGVEITGGTVTVPLYLQTLSEKIRFDLHDRVAVEFVSGQEITVWWQCHMWLDTNWLSARRRSTVWPLCSGGRHPGGFEAAVTSVWMKELHCSHEMI